MVGSAVVCWARSADRLRTLAALLLSFSEAFLNSFIIVIVSTVLVLVLAIPAAYALSIYPIGNWRDALFFFISTKFLPIVAAILPLWIIARELGLLNTHLVLIILYTAMNLPLAVWMASRSRPDVPRVDISRAPRCDRASRRTPGCCAPSSPARANRRRCRCRPAP